jgi:hypothetical protein
MSLLAKSTGTLSLSLSAGEKEAKAKAKEARRAEVKRLESCYGRTIFKRETKYFTPVRG